MTYSEIKLMDQLDNLYNDNRYVDGQSIHPDLILPVLSQVLHPRRCLIPRSIHYLQISHLES